MFQIGDRRLRIADFWKRVRQVYYCPLPGGESPLRCRIRLPNFGFVKYADALTRRGIFVFLSPLDCAWLEPETEFRLQRPTTFTVAETGTKDPVRSFRSRCAR